MAKGVVCSIHLDHPHQTIVIKRQLKDGQVIFTSYKHLQVIYVKTGMQVDQSTKLARLYTRQEAKKLGGNYDHLHLEIRKSFDDYGCGSWFTITKSQLDTYFYEPITFIKTYVKK
ncbi:MAG: peptidoglycan DD-metalloendopeptidase family protein [Bacteroidota bacterium]